LQEEVFAMQVRLARDLQRPVSIHCRKAFGRLAEIVERESGIPYGGLIHSYSGSKDFALVLERLGFYLSFSGSITHAGNKHGREALSAVSLPRLLIETDSPDLPPEGLPRNGVNEPANLSVVLSAVADLLGRPKEEIAKLTKENSERLFGANTSSKYGGCGVL
jgi:TatD DNase family protein